MNAGNAQGTVYHSFLLFVFNCIYSLPFFAAPHNVTNISVKNFGQTSLILEWNKVNNNTLYNYRLSYNSKNASISGSDEGSVVKYTATDLTAGTEYTFTLYTVFKEVESRGSNIAWHTSQYVFCF